MINNFAQILYKRNPVVSVIEFWTTDNCNRMIALAAVVGAEIVDIEHIDPERNQFSGFIRIAHPENIDIPVIADAAGVTDIPTDDIDEDEQGDAVGKAGSEDVPDFDQYFMKPVFIPLFIWDDGEMRPFQGFCRGYGPIYNQKDWEETIGVFTAEGKYFSVLIDSRVRCALPQFFIDQKPFHHPIVSFATMGPWVDPETGILKSPPNLQQLEPVLQNTPSIEPDSVEAEKPTEKPTSSGAQQ